MSICIFRFSSGFTMRIASVAFMACLLIAPGRSACADHADLSEPLTAVGKLDTAEISGETLKAATELSSLSSDHITDVLGAFENATVRGKNWLRAIASDVADNGEFDRAAVQRFFDDRSGDKDARYLAFQLLVANGVDKNTLLSTAETDPSLPVRYLKIEQLLKNASEAVKSESNDDAIAILNSVVENGRSPRQLQDAAKSLKELDQPVDLAKSLGMIRNWKVIGPFDNENSKHFDTLYTPEQSYVADGNPVDETALKGKSGDVTWQTVESDSEMGMVDINPTFENAKDSVAYAFTQVQVSEKDAGPATVRLGCITANKVWVNGVLATANNVYHSGTRIDQYTGDCKLVPGENTIFVKVLQNAQTEPWAQDWQFQLRLTNPNGDAIRPVE